MNDRRGAAAVVPRARRLLHGDVGRAIVAGVGNRPDPGMEGRLDAGIAWLRRAQDHGQGGVSAVFDLADGWQPPYPETTGYIVGTFLHHHELTGDDESRTRALALGEWLLDIQGPEGAFAGGPHMGDARPLVFDTGQVLLGLVALAELTGDERFAQAAGAAGSWLVREQGEDGAWAGPAGRGRPHAYDARVAWALARAGLVLDDRRFTAGARRAVEWIVQQGQPNGWMPHMGFDDEAQPLTHTIAYTIEGLVEWSLVSEAVDSAAWSAATAMLEALQHAHHRQLEQPRRRSAPGLAARFDASWSTRDRWSCVTGALQTALCAHRVGVEAGRSDLLTFADEVLQAALRHQLLVPRRPDLHGGVPGSAPIWGPYGSFRLINWGAKFLVDAVLQHRRKLPTTRFS